MPYRSFSSLIVLLAAAGLAAFPGSAAAACPGADAFPSAGPNPAAAAAVRCLVNEVRVANGRRPLRPDPRLSAAASAWSERLVAARFYAHDDPFTGSTIDTRGRRSGYIGRSQIWALGENLAWGTGFRSSPREAVAMWKASPLHRENMLDPTWRDIGAGVAYGTPVGAVGGTYAIEFGMKVVAVRSRSCRKGANRGRNHKRKACARHTRR